MLLGSLEEKSVRHIRKECGISLKQLCVEALIIPSSLRSAGQSTTQRYKKERERMLTPPKIPQVPKSAQESFGLVKVLEEHNLSLSKVHLANQLFLSKTSFT